MKCNELKNHFLEIKRIKIVLMIIIWIYINNIIKFINKLDFKIINNK